ncbi:hypothetical protein Taro_018246 [Colocasia esculenta]|uniref:Peptidase A1 domain-containing protein n=1 Tax=Colocasia esculenta TaxID=4460 RepID=A0A843UTD8_COLES|nr:hypothetical protein [Colocasia esculenta]
MADQYTTALALRKLMIVVLMMVIVNAGATLPVASPAATDGIRLEMTRVDHIRGNFSKLEMLQRAVRRSRHRANTLVMRAVLAAGNGLGDEVQAPVHAGSGEFIMDLAIGTPPVPFPAILDTGSDLIWTQCKPCTQCYRQKTAIFDPSSSKSFSKLPCSSKLCRALPTSTCDSDCQYVYSYGDYSSTQGVLATETFTFGYTSSSSKKAVSVAGIGFGCSGSNEGKGFEQAAGLVGLGRGPLSLNSQLGVGKFSYCLTKLDDSSKKSPLLLGSVAKLSSGHAQSTPLLRSATQPSFYYLSLKGITVGATALSIPKDTFAFSDDGSGGLIIDSGTSITYLEKAAYGPLKKAFLSQVKLPVGNGSDVGLDLCFQLPEGGSSADGVEVPKLVLHLDGADMQLPAENYMILDGSSGQLCLMVMGSNGMSILGNFQQMNFHVLYDVEGGRLAFEPAHCDQL